jgi:hypothetical protein
MQEVFLFYRGLKPISSHVAKCDRGKGLIMRHWKNSGKHEKKVIKARSSFLKKRTKKLLSWGSGRGGSFATGHGNFIRGARSGRHTPGFPAYCPLR